MANYKKYSDYLKQKYGEKVYKLPVNLPLTCPNRDGQLGYGGCIFCAETGAGFECHPSDMPIEEQLSKNARYIGSHYGAGKFIAYFQNFSNTYLALEDFKNMLYCVDAESIVGVSISTRPDLIHPKYLDIAKEFSMNTGKDIYIELGLQTVNYKTLKKINRGHSLAEFIYAVNLIKSYSLPVTAHLILNLPWDDMADTIEASKIVSALKVNFIKLHSLYIMEHTELGRQYQNGEIKLISCQEYIERVAAFLQYLSPDIYIERLVGRAPEEGSLFVNWGMSSFKVMNLIEEYLYSNQIFKGKTA